MWPLLIAAAAQVANTMANYSSDKKKRDYDRTVTQKSEQEIRRKAIQDAIGARSYGIRPAVSVPDISSERTIGGISNIVGNAAASYMGSQAPTQASPTPQGQFGDSGEAIRQEAIRRRIQGTTDPYGGSYGLS